jgi:hypothetical protein
MPTTPAPGYMSILPKGLLSFLDIKNDAAYPQRLGLELAPVLDLFEWYMQTNAELITGVTSALTVGAGASNIATPTPIAVPEKEWWYVSEYTTAVNPGAGAAVDVACGCQLFGSGTVTFVVGGYQAAAANQDARAKNDHPFFVGPGSQFVTLVRSVTLAPTATQVIRFSRLRV